MNAWGIYSVTLGNLRKTEVWKGKEQILREMPIIKYETYKSQHEIMRMDLVKEGLGQGKNL